VKTQRDGRGLESSVLEAVAPGGSSTQALARWVGLPHQQVLAAVHRLGRSGLVEVSGDLVVLTEAGRSAVADASRPMAAAGADAPKDLGDLVELLGSRWPAAAERAVAEGKARDALLASDEDRDRVVERLEEAFAQGRLTTDERNDRVGAALSARTHGDLDEVLHGLGGLPPPARPRHPVRAVVFWVVAVLASPIVLLAAPLLFFGTDLGDHVGGLFFLAVLLPGLFALRRWAWPRG
jgi:hypothetical protein